MNDVDPHPSLPLAAALEGGLAILAVALGWLCGLAPLATFDWSAAAVLWGLAAAGPMLLVALAAIHLPLGPLSRLMSDVVEQVLPHFAACRTVDLAIIGVLAGVGEELLFRGVVQAGIAGWIGGAVGAGVALVASAVVFGLLHFLSATYALFATGVGLYLGGLWLWTGNLLAPMVAHAVYDFAVLAYLLSRAGSGAERAAG